MSVSLSQQSSSFSNRSISSASAMHSAMSIGMKGRISTGSFKSRTPSMHGGAGGFGTRISTSVLSAGGSLTPYTYSETALINDEKFTMQNLNDRLASYLGKVRSLEAANRKLELQIREFYDKRAPTVSKDFTAFFATISDLRAQIARRYSENQRVILQIDNAQLSADDFKMKYEMELNMHNLVEADVARLRGVRDSLTLTASELEMQIEGLKEELAYMRSNHEEEMHLLRVQSTGNVNVEVDSTESVDMSKVLAEMREQYESVMEKNKRELETWFQSKVEALQTEIRSQETGVRTFNMQISELKKTYQTLEINRQSAYTEIQYLQQNLEEVKGRYSAQLSQLQMTITMLETELQQLRVSLEEQQTKYSLLLDIKMRLELEIAEYRRLLEGEYYEQKKAVVIREEVQEVKPHIEKRVKTIVEEIVDGKVVSSSVDTQVETIQ